MVLASFMEKKTPAGAGRDLSPASEFNSRAKNRSPSQPQVQQSMPHTASHRAAWIWQKPLLKKCWSLYFCHWQKSLNGDLTANLVSTDFPRLRHQGVNTVSDGAAGSSGGGGKKKKSHTEVRTAVRVVQREVNPWSIVCKRFSTWSFNWMFEEQITG